MRNVARIGGAALLAIAVLACVVDVRREWPGPGLIGAAHVRSAGIKHGQVVLEERTKTGAPPISTTTTEWRLDPGVRISTYSRRLARIGGQTSSVHEVAVALPVALFGGLLIALTLPVHPVAAGQCVCGYSLVGLPGDRCPECGASVT